jgi:gliding-associated putative ABC transporter substrate-binding component GldG
MDSLQSGTGGTIALPYQLNLEDQLFRYGVRINNDFIQDIQCANYPVVVGNMGNQPQIVPLPWPFFPLINTYADHPVVKNLDAMYLRFVSSMDTIKADGILKTPLLYTSQYTRRISNPVLVDIDELRQAPKPEFFKGGSFPIGYLLEGSFTSVFKNRLLPEGTVQESYKAQGIASKILVCSDGDLIRNETNPQNGKPYPLGFEPFLSQTYANKDFIVNIMAYMTDENGIINARAKEIKIRPLDPVKVENERWQWQIINLLLPLIILLIYGIVLYYFRKHKYARKVT